MHAGKYCATAAYPATALKGFWPAVVHESVHLLLVRLRTEAVGLVDAFAHEDYVLHSAIGSRDGDYVTRLVRMAEGSPFNETQEGPAWRDLLGPFLNKSKATGGSSAPRPKL